MKTETNEAELEAIKQELAYRAEYLLRLTKAFTVHDVKHPDVLITMRQAQILYHDAYIKLAYFIGRECRKACL